MVLLPGLFVTNLQDASLLAGVVDGAVHVKFLILTVLVGVVAQAAEGHLKLADVQHIVVTEIPVRPLTGHPQGGTVLADPAHADAVGL